MPPLRDLDRVELPPQTGLAWPRGRPLSIAGLSIRSHFQPIVSPLHQRIVGFEALMRAQKGGLSMAPPDAFGHAQSFGINQARLDRLTRAMHLLNYPFAERHSHWLFLNIATASLSEYRHEEALLPSALLQRGDLRPDQVVVEMVEQSVSDDGLLRAFVQSLREAGHLIAVDDFGAGHSNFDRIWELEPDIVKLDSGMLWRAEKDPKVRRLLPRIVSLLREAGALVIIEGVETETQAHIALDAGADLLQGYLFGRPQQAPEGDQNVTDTVRCLLAGHQPQQAVDHSDDPLYGAFLDTVLALQRGASLEQASANLRPLSSLSRCFLVNGDGVQLGESLDLREGDGIQRLRRFRPLQETEGACWATRSYFTEACARPDQVCVSSPYLSVTDGRLCVTYSMAFKRAAGLRVLCVDQLCE